MARDVFGNRKTTKEKELESEILKPTLINLPFALIGSSLGPIASKKVDRGIFFACSAEIEYSNDGVILPDSSYASDR